MLRLPRYLQWQSFLANLTVVWLAILCYRYNPFFAQYLEPQTQHSLMQLAISYSVLHVAALFLPLPFQTNQPSKALLGLRTMYLLVRKLLASPGAAQTFQPTTAEQMAARFLLVKLVFIPLMVQFFIWNYAAVRTHAGVLLQSPSLFRVALFHEHLYPFLINAMLLVDVTYFLVGYITESRFLGNTLRSVEPTVIGWMVALACYPPSNTLTTTLLGWSAAEAQVFSSPVFMVWWRIGILVFFAIYLSATIALGTKASNLTNRGVVSVGPYAYIRHPAYITKNMAWFMMMLPIFHLWPLLSWAGWAWIYHLRSITEERHLATDPDYQEYMKRVPWRYVPGIY